MISAAILYCISILYVCYYAHQTNWLSIIGPIAIAGICFVYLYKRINNQKQLNQILMLVFATKLIIVFAFPNLSDDIYRFKWDGLLVSHGINPFINTPTEVLNRYTGTIANELNTLYPLLNSKEYHTVYPLISQAVFGFCSMLSGEDITTFSMLLKCVYLIADVALLFSLIQLLKSSGFQSKKSLLFYASPLCIVELNGNLHFELFLILFLCLAILNYNQSHLLKSGFNLGLSVISKLNSFLFGILFLSKSDFIKKNVLLVFGFLIPLLAAAWFILPGINGYKASLGLYFHQFEFNSFLYGHLTHYCDVNKFYDEKKLVGIYLMICFILLAIYLVIKWWFNTQRSFSFKTAWYLLFSYLLLSSTVHPWYLTLLVFLSCFYLPLTGISWSYLVFFSYTRYDSKFELYEPILVFMEYFLVIIVLIYELHSNRKLNLNLT
ncbi:MAG: hypothetical protein V9E90_10120 [Saprospiraceae bacterium]|jgi:hypothetical protein